MMKRLIPVVIKSPWLGELNAQLGGRHGRRNHTSSIIIPRKSTNYQAIIR
jgi:hypothetical protein